MKRKTPVSSTSRILAVAAVAIGIGLLIAAIFADDIGLSGGGEGVGWKQLIAAISGLIIAVGGVGWLFQRSRFESSL
jgi:hypothetical protein